MNREEEYFYYNNLFDLYGELLTEREQDIFKLFYEEDLSLGEIATHFKVSKSAIGKTIKIVNKKLEMYEEKIKIAYKKEKIKKILINNKDYDKVMRILND
ncbi:MAG: HTH domain-containing protein [Bacilli bacterium]|nr:HTH domain-containing protein [Bacilli bacterium]